jgi:flagellar basal body rod protein FlgG
VTSTYTSYNLIARDLPRSIERIASQPQVARESEYYLKRISEIKSIDEFMADTRVFNYAMKAHGLEDMNYAKAFMRKVLTEGVDKEDAFANQLADSKYKEFAETFNFARNGETATIFNKAQQGTVDKYHRLTLEEEAGVDNTGVRLALYFERTAPELDSVYGILADTALYEVVRTALGIPAEIAASDIDKQAEMLKSRLDIEDFKDPEKLNTFMQRFTALWELDNPSFGFVGFKLAAEFVHRFRHHAGADALNQQSQTRRPLMQGSLYVSLSSQIALERRLTTLADNVANANTIGFRATEVKFNEVLANTGSTDVSFVDEGQDYLSTANGGLKTTGSALDFAIRGDAWFMIETPTGKMLTRDGRFTLTNTGALVNIDGFPVLDPGEAPIQLDPDGEAPKAGRDGGLTQDGFRRGAIGLLPGRLSPDLPARRRWCIVPTIPPEPVLDEESAGLLQGYIENSNVNAMSEMSNLIIISRAFENISAMTNSTEDVFKEAIRTLGSGR